VLIFSNEAIALNREAANVHVPDRADDHVPHVPDLADDQIRVFHQLWAEWHTKKNPTAEWLKDFLSRVPIGCDCGDSFSRWIERNSPRFEDWFPYSVEGHNFVNEKLNRPLFTTEEAKRRWLVDYVLWQPYVHGGLERWADALIESIPNAGMVLNVTEGPEPHPLVPKLSISEALDLEVPILVSCVYDTSLPVRSHNSRIIAVAHGVCDYTNNWIQKGRDTFTEYVGVSELVSKKVMEWTGQKCNTIHNGADAPLAARSRIEVRDELLIPQKAFVIVYTGRMVAEKQIPVLIDSLKYDSAYLLLVGWDALGNVPRWLRDHSAASRVRYVPAVSNVGDYLGCSDVFCSPSREEGFGLSLLEAVQFGLPCVSTPTGVATELALSIVPVNVDAETLARACETATPKPNDLSHLSKRSFVDRWRKFLRVS
jgi:glycosyltransferase involved in cell wall biosynthesis